MIVSGARSWYCGDGATDASLDSCIHDFAVGEEAYEVGGVSKQESKTKMAPRSQERDQGASFCY